MESVKYTQRETHYHSEPPSFVTSFFHHGLCCSYFRTRPLPFCRLQHFKASAGILLFYHVYLHVCHLDKNHRKRAGLRV